MRVKSLRIAAIVFLAVPVASGCGGDDDNGDGGQAANPAPTTTQTTGESPAAASRALIVRMTEYAFDPKDAVAKAGKVTITAPNDGQTVHELVVLKTDEDPAALPKKGEKSTRARASERSRMFSRERPRRRRSSLRRGNTPWCARCPAITRAGCTDRLPSSSGLILLPGEAASQGLQPPPGDDGAAGQKARCGPSPEGEMLVGGSALPADAGFSVLASGGLLSTRALVFSKQAPDLLFGMGRCLGRLGALPEKLVSDREGAIHAGGGRPTQEFAACCGRLAVGWIILEPGTRLSAAGSSRARAARISCPISGHTSRQRVYKKVTA
jgi:hypothetical protein